MVKRRPSRGTPGSGGGGGTRGSPRQPAGRKQAPRTVPDLVAAAAQLERAQLRELRDAVDRLEKNSRAILIPTSRATCRLVRLDDGEFIALHQRSLALDDDGYFAALHRRQEELLFAEVYLTLRELTGPSGRYFDDWKSSFSFPFALDVLKGPEEFSYLFEVRNYRSYLDFPIRKVMAADDPRLEEGRILPHLAEEFSGQEMEDFLARFCSYLADSWEAIQHRPREPFLQKVVSSHIVFGWCGGKCFEAQYATERGYEAACKRYANRLEEERTALQSGAPRKRSRRRSG